MTTETTQPDLIMEQLLSQLEQKSQLHIHVFKVELDREILESLRKVHLFLAEESTENKVDKKTNGDTGDKSASTYAELATALMRFVWQETLQADWIIKKSGAAAEEELEFWSEANRELVLTASRVFFMTSQVAGKRCDLPGNYMCYIVAPVAYIHLKEGKAVETHPRVLFVEALIEAMMDHDDISPYMIQIVERLMRISGDRGPQYANFYNRLVTVFSLLVEKDYPSYPRDRMLRYLLGHEPSNTMLEALLVKGQDLPVFAEFLVQQSPASIYEESTIGLFALLVWRFRRSVKSLIHKDLEAFLIKLELEFDLSLKFEDYSEIGYLKTTLRLPESPLGRKRVFDRIRRIVDAIRQHHGESKKTGASSLINILSGVLSYLCKLNSEGMTYEVEVREFLNSLQANEVLHVLQESSLPCVAGVVGSVIAARVNFEPDATPVMVSTLFDWNSTVGDWLLKEPEVRLVIERIVHPSLLDIVRGLKTVEWMRHFVQIVYCSRPLNDALITTLTAAAVEEHRRLLGANGAVYSAFAAEVISLNRGPGQMLVVDGLNIMAKNNKKQLAVHERLLAVSTLTELYICPTVDFPSWHWCEFYCSGEDCAALPVLVAARAVPGSCQALRRNQCVKIGEWDDPPRAVIWPLQLIFHALRADHSLFTQELVASSDIAESLKPWFRSVDDDRCGFAIYLSRRLIKLISTPRLQSEFIDKVRKAILPSPGRSSWSESLLIYHIELLSLHHSLPLFADYSVRDFRLMVQVLSDETTLEEFLHRLCDFIVAQGDVETGMKVLEEIIDPLFDAWFSITAVNRDRLQVVERLVLPLIERSDFSRDIYERLLFKSPNVFAFWTRPSSWSGVRERAEADLAMCIKDWYLDLVDSTPQPIRELDKYSRRRTVAKFLNAFPSASKEIWTKACADHSLVAHLFDTAYRSRSFSAILAGMSQAIVPSGGFREGEEGPFLGPDALESIVSWMTETGWVEKSGLTADLWDMIRLIGFNLRVGSEGLVTSQDVQAFYEMAAMNVVLGEWERGNLPLLTADDSVSEVLKGMIKAPDTFIEGTLLDIAIRVHRRKTYTNAMTQVWTRLLALDSAKMVRRLERVCAKNGMDAGLILRRLDAHWNQWLQPRQTSPPSPAQLMDYIRVVDEQLTWFDVPTSLNVLIPKCGSCGIAEVRASCLKLMFHPRIRRSNWRNLVVFLVKEHRIVVRFVEVLLVLCSPYTVPRLVVSRCDHQSRPGVALPSDLVRLLVTYLRIG